MKIINTKKLVLILLSIIFLTSLLGIQINAEGTGIAVAGKVYVLDEKEDYNISPEDDFISVQDSNETIGVLNITGNITNAYKKDDFDAYEISDGPVLFSYSKDRYINASNETEWHLISDDKKSVNGISTKKIQNGVLIVQSSRDGEHWAEDKIVTNYFVNDQEAGYDYSTNDIQATNGTYFRIILAYKLGKVVGNNQIFFWNNPEIESKRIMEVYEFFVQSRTEGDSVSDSRYSLTDISSKINTGSKDNGYSGVNDITKKDPHFGWELGEFYVSGFTQKIEDKNDNPVFLKNVGDQVSLNFSLKQDIDALNGNDALYITDDEDGWDQNFEVKQQNFGRGTVIIKYTNYKNEKTDPIVYTNFLEANATTTADTTVYTFEEGDYEVCLDYEIRYDKNKILNASIAPETNHYRIYFKFLIRNSNCMVFPFEIDTGKELNNSSYTDKGFYLDTANSHYLRINVTKETLNETQDGLVEDVRFSKEARDGSKYTDNGIYTITVSNIYTGQSVSKKIYVGSDPVVKAYMVTGMSLPEIKALIMAGATINEDGTINYPDGSSKEDNTETEEPSVEPASDKDDLVISENNSINMPVVIGIGTSIIVLIVLVIIGWNKKKSNERKRRIEQEQFKENAMESGNDKGFESDENEKVH